MKKRRYFLIIFLCIMSISFICSPAQAAKKKKSRRYAVSAKSAILMNSTNSKQLFGKNIHRAVLPASTVKVMTALLVLEKLPLDRVITIGNQADTVQPSKVNLKPGEHYTVEDLLYAALMMSANDAAVVLAETVAGSEAEFIKLMNQRARKLGAKHTRFANAHGLPTKREQHTTAYDMYLIFRQALKHPFFKDAMVLRYKTISSQEGRKIFLKNHNKLLWKAWKNPAYGKTGYTRKAMSCFVGFVNRGGETLIVAVFGCSRRWDDIRYITAKYGRVRQ
ncbi:MAG TPA: D-alanyl-D-alanine carboxypeptidase family protein [Candidatus Omnitrophota bacterium]|nr:D-alanyl-D-alanine carboxypeptidase family protein [Candidatus Omnitrophota bacterium]HPD84508.1 D-alanyl-D-alanine carboxypeptidase family protein [Candidatus Omnitrophota bacterium]HRZ03366.1 D-alanyl-D-alanine carboxypeptidase family protein [Candidatus Omnitrophota bacterium]